MISRTQVSHLIASRKAASYTIKKGACLRPFMLVSLYKDYSAPGRALVRSCCDSWLSPLGKEETPSVSLSSFSLGKVLSSSFYSSLRKSVTDGSFIYCDKEKCPFFKDREQDFDYYQGLVQGKHMKVELSFDDACNLTCPSCRNKASTSPSPYMLSIFNQLLQENVSEIFLNGAGELFLNKDLLNRLRTLTPEDSPYLQKLHLITNASIFTPLQYNLLSDHTKTLIKKVDISLDSLDPETYSILRRGANLNTTITNLKNLISLRKTGALEEISILVVVQKRNVQELPEIFDFCESNGIDNLCLWKLDDRNHKLQEEGITEGQYIAISQFIKEKRDTSKVRVISAF